LSSARPCRNLWALVSLLITRIKPNKLAFDWHGLLYVTRLIQRLECKTYPNILYGKWLWI
jgi:hypothetical protein